jgi:hypothetical protein
MRLGVTSLGYMYVRHSIPNSGRHLIVLGKVGGERGPTYHGKLQQLKAGFFITWIPHLQRKWIYTGEQV